MRLIALFCERLSTVMRTSGVVTLSVLVILLPRSLLVSLSLSTGTMFATQGVGPISSVTLSKIPKSICFSISLLIASLRWNGTGRSFCRTGSTSGSNSKCTWMSLTHPSFPLNKFGNMALNSSFEYLPSFMGGGYFLRMFSFCSGSDLVLSTDCSSSILTTSRFTAVR